MDTARALRLMKLAPAAVAVCESIVAAEDAYQRGEITFPERAALRIEALAVARSIVNEANQETAT